MHLQKLKADMMSEGQQKVADLQTEMNSGATAGEKSAGEIIVDFDHLLKLVNKRLHDLESKLSSHQRK